MTVGNIRRVGIFAEIAARYTHYTGFILINIVSAFGRGIIAEIAARHIEHTI